MNAEALDAVLSSRARVRIEDALSLRPRTLNELAAVTGISVQGVLRHLKLLMKLGLVEERRLNPVTPKARIVYAAKSMAVGDYSTSGLMMVKSTPLLRREVSGGGVELERMAGEVLVRRSQVRSAAKRLGREIDELVAAQESLQAALDSMPLGDYERLILGVLLTEETIEDGVRVLSKYYGIGDRRSIDKALAKARRIVDK
jgi:DNA-binding transcriptional ArsR family regulator